MKVDASIFKAYDIRGVVDRTLTEDAVRAVGLMLDTMAHDAGVKRFNVGRDGRLTGERLQNALVEGIVSTGMDVLDIGAVPTPVRYYATKHFDCGTGVAVAGSHNPPEYNGLKMMVAGVTLFADQIQGIRERIEREDWYVAEKPGRIEHVDAVAPYVQKALEGVRLFRQLKVAVDAGNGIVGPTILRILSKLDVEVVPLYCDVDGHFPNHHPDPSKPKNLEALIDEVEEVGADYGFALDGDGDRLGVVTNAGEVIYPDRLMMLFTEDILRTHPGAQIVYDVKCSRKLVDWVRAKGGEPVISLTSHSLEKAKLRETAAPFASEMSGLLFFNAERLTGFDDGLYSAVRLLEILSRSESPSTVLQGLPNAVNTPEIRIPTEEDGNKAFIAAFQKECRFPGAESVITIDGVLVSSGRTGLRSHALPIRRPWWSYVSKATRRNRSSASSSASLPRCFASTLL